MGDHGILRIVQLNSMLKGGGTDDQSVKLSRGLRESGCEVTIFGPGDREFSKVAKSLDVPLADSGREGPLKWRFIKGAARLIRQCRPQIVHAHHGRDYWPAVLAARLSGSKPILVLSRHLAKSPGSALSRGFLLSQCDAMIAVSGAVAEILKRGSREPDAVEEERRNRPPMRGDHRKIHVIHAGIDTNRFHPLPPPPNQRRAWNIPEDAYIFALVGGYDLPRGKGQLEFLRAAAMAARALPQARFVMIGRGNMEDLLKAEIQRLGLEQKALLAPYAHNMPEVMNAIDCLVHPAVGTDAFPLVLLEALASGKPVIASAIDGIPEAFAAAPCGALVAPESIEQLSAAMIAVPAQPKLDPGEMHRRVDAAFSLKQCVSKTLDLYARLVAANESA